MNASVSLFLIFFVAYSCNQSPEMSASLFHLDNTSSSKIKGLNFVAPPDPFPNNPMKPVIGAKADWIAVIPYAYSRKGNTFVKFNSKWQWWGETPGGAEKTIQLAKQEGLKVMLKPQVYVPGSWPGGIDFETEEQWKTWEKDYLNYLAPFLEMAVQYEVEMFCIGTEFKISTAKRSAFWKQLIRDIRKQYNGQLTYAANWDEFEDIGFWNELDFIGVDAYFPLSDDPTPGVETLVENWKPWKIHIEKIQRQFNKPILFTEYGYLSVDHCASRTWELEPLVKQLPINQQAQSNAIEGLFQTFWSEPYWAGGFLWKWFPNMQGHEGYLERDYTPQGKKAEEVLKKWFSKD